MAINYAVMARKPIIAGNWKMHMTVPEGLALIDGILPSCKGKSDVEVVVAPPFTALSAISERLKGSGIGLAAQNMHYEAKGAFTGEVSPAMLKDAGCTHVIIGHSERRQFFCETDQTVNKKVLAALSNGLVPIMCIGETLDQREAGKAFEVIEGQLAGGLAGLTAVQVAGMILAYEPVWAIGTGRTATPDQAQEVHAFIRGWLKEKYGPATADKVRIQYGGSVKPDNVTALMDKADIDGALVGGACLTAESFNKLVNYKG